MPSFSKNLENMRACQEAIDWVGKRGLMSAWRDCPRADWMLWLAGELDIDRKLLVLAACDCAETALQYVPKGENRPAKAIETARAWCEGKATIQDCQKAAYAAAYAAYASAYASAYAASAAANAAYAAANAAYAAANAAYAAYAAANAASAAYAAANAADKQCAELIRARIPFQLIKDAYNGK